MKNVLITGGAGFIGANFVHYLRETYPGVSIFVLDNLTYAGNMANLRSLEGTDRFNFIRGDITDRDFVNDLFSKKSFDTVVHFAAESHVDRSILGPGAFINTNILGTFALLEAARATWDGNYSGKRFLHVSTDEVYGSLGAEGLFTEETAYAPNSPYAASKAASDHLVRAYFHTYGLPCVTTNCSNNYGPYQFPEKLIPLIIINGLLGKPLPIYGDGMNIRDWLYVEDHCSAITTVLEKGRLGETYNIGGKNEWTNIDIVNLVCDIVDEFVEGSEEYSKLYPLAGGRRGLITYVKDRPGHDRRYAIDSAKIEAELGWEPAESFETGIRKTVKWYLENRSWWEEIQSGAYRDYYEEQYGERLS